MSWGSEIHAGARWGRQGRVFAGEDVSVGSIGGRCGLCEPQPSPHSTTRCLMGVSFSRWREGFQHWMDLREMQVYQFMSNIIKQVLNAKGEAQDREGGAPGSPWRSEVVQRGNRTALPSPTQPAVAPSPKPASRRD